MSCHTPTSSHSESVPVSSAVPECTVERVLPLQTPQSTGKREVHSQDTDFPTPAKSLSGSRVLSGLPSVRPYFHHVHYGRSYGYMGPRRGPLIVSTFDPVIHERKQNLVSFT